MSNNILPSTCTLYLKDKFPQFSTHGYFQSHEELVSWVYWNSGSLPWLVSFQRVSACPANSTYHLVLHDIANAVSLHCSKAGMHSVHKSLSMLRWYYADKDTTCIYMDKEAINTCIYFNTGTTTDLGGGEGLEQIFLGSRECYSIMYAYGLTEIVTAKTF